MEQAAELTDRRISPLGHERSDMLSFVVYSNGEPVEQLNLAGAYVVGTDDVPLRAEISFKNGVISCKKRAAGPAGIALQWNVAGAGVFLVETIRVQERDKPYVLQVELARGRLMRVNQKLEDWGLIDYDGVGPILEKLAQARDTLIEALQSDEPAKAAALGDKSLSIAVQASEELSRFHAAALIMRRKQTNGFGKRVFGCSLHLDQAAESTRKRVTGAFDFVTLPIVWRDVEPTEQTFNWKPLDAWVDALSKGPVPIRGSSLLAFSERNVPDWLYIWEHDFDTIRDLAFEHVKRVINRYGQYIQTWTIASGIHANNCFTFSFEQLMELTRMTAALTKQLCPRGHSILELVGPWGEYYARNQRTIPPLLYADMAVQGGVNFDAFGLQFLFGPPSDGMFLRDMFQISACLDQFSKFGKPVHVTALQAPSSPVLVRGEDGTTSSGGEWRGPWTEQGQSDWLRRFMEVALSKPYVESVSWSGLVDNPRLENPNGGLVKTDVTPKAAYKQLLALRTEWLGASQRPAEA